MRAGTPPPTASSYSERTVDQSNDTSAADVAATAANNSIGKVSTNDNTGHHHHQPNNINNDTTVSNTRATDQQHQDAGDERGEGEIMHPLSTSAAAAAVESDPSPAALLNQIPTNIENLLSLSRFDHPPPVLQPPPPNTSLSYRPPLNASPENENNREEQDPAAAADEVGQQGDTASIPESNPPEYFDADKFATVVHKTLRSRLRRTHIMPLLYIVPVAIVLLILNTFRGTGLNLAFTFTAVFIVGIAFPIYLYLSYRARAIRLDALKQMGLLADTPESELWAVIQYRSPLPSAPLYDPSAPRYDDLLPRYETTIARAISSQSSLAPPSDTVGLSRLGSNGSLPSLRGMLRSHSSWTRMQQSNSRFSLLPGLQNQARAMSSASSSSSVLTGGGGGGLTMGSMPNPISILRDASPQPPEVRVTEPEPANQDHVYIVEALTAPNTALTSMNRTASSSTLRREFLSTGFFSQSSNANLASSSSQSSMEMHERGSIAERRWPRIRGGSFSRGAGGRSVSPMLGGGPSQASSISSLRERRDQQERQQPQQQQQPQAQPFAVDGADADVVEGSNPSLQGTPGENEEGQQPSAAPPTNLDQPAARRPRWRRARRQSDTQRNRGGPGALFPAPQTIAVQRTAGHPYYTGYTPRQARIFAELSDPTRRSMIVNVETRNPIDRLLMLQQGPVIVSEVILDEREYERAARAQRREARMNEELLARALAARRRRGAASNTAVEGAEASLAPTPARRQSVRFICDELVEASAQPPVPGSSTPSPANPSITATIVGPFPPLPPTTTTTTSISTASNNTIGTAEAITIVTTASPTMSVAEATTTMSKSTSKLSGNALSKILNAAPQIQPSLSHKSLATSLGSGVSTLDEAETSLAPVSLVRPKIETRNSSDDAPARSSIPQ